MNNIRQYLDNQFLSVQSEDTCRAVANILRNMKYDVKELYDINMMVVFSPNYQEVK